MSRNCPEYTDGFFDLYRIKESEESDFPEQYYADTSSTKSPLPSVSMKSGTRYAMTSTPSPTRQTARFI